MNKGANVTYRRWLDIILASLLAVALVILSGMFVMYRIINQPGYAEKIGDPLVLINEKVYTVKNQSCDLLIFGDSSTTTGIDPRILQREGISVCDISATMPVVEAFGTMTVDTFLANNPRPKILLLQFSPETFYREDTWDHVALFTPIALLLRDTPPSFAARKLVTHVSAVVRVEEIIIKQQLFPPVPAERTRLEGVFQRTMATYRDSGGLLTFEQTPQTICNTPPVDLYAPVAADWIQQQRRRYEALGIKVIVRSSPIPDCDPQLALFRRELTPSLDADIETYPIGYFFPGDRHLTQAGAAMESEELVRQITSIAAGREVTPRNRSAR